MGKIIPCKHAKWETKVGYGTGWFCYGIDDPHFHTKWDCYKNKGALCNECPTRKKKQQKIFDFIK